MIQLSMHVYTKATYVLLLQQTLSPTMEVDKEQKLFLDMKGATMTDMKERQSKTVPSSEGLAETGAATQMPGAEEREEFGLEGDERYVLSACYC